MTDIDKGRFRSAERFGRDALGLAGAQSNPLHVWLRDWSMSADGSTWHIHASQAGYALTLDMAALAPPVLNGERGLSQKSGSPGDASYYYSIPRMTVHGQILRDGQSISVEGLSWLDREWGSGGLSAQQTGWDWFALQLSDGSTLMFYSLRRRDGQQDVHSAGTWVAEDGGVRALACDDVALSVDLRPVLPDQELGTTPRYWEGAVAVSGTRDKKVVAGQGYIELVGYAR